MTEPGGPNIVLLTLDALRADHVSSCGYDRETTPNLDRFAAENVQFSNAYSVSTHTREAIPGLLTGRYPNACVDDGYELAADTIASHLRETDYTTGAFHANPYVSRAYGFDRDFDVFDDDLYLGQHKLVALAQRAYDKIRNRHYARAETINERALEFVDSAEEPFFLWAHYMDPHGPYSPPQEYQTVFHDEYVRMKRAQKMYKRAAVSDPESITDDERQEMVNLYDEEIRYADAQLGAFLDELEARGLLEETLVIVTADHGDAFGERGYYGHPRELDPELLRVPLVARGPGVPAGEIEVPTSTVDVVPTVLEATGYSVASLPGTSLREIAGDTEAYADRTVFSGVRGDDRYDEEHLRRFRADSLDGWARVERAIESDEVVDSEGDEELLESLRSHSDRLLDGVAVSGDAGERASKDVERRLEALGYKE
ncbi:sulfatase [Natronomonas halophila]|uniref:sulfatase n=1 Tax=Natronomonas halophila TaxID=2747817 RepID=UPI0015B61E9A|nr:sulfatase [Natronomonas halophila]QLD87072.1 sulfatase [Natronomonas halophila]